MSTRLPAALVSLALVSAGPPPSADPDALVRAANAAFGRGDADAAEGLYAAAAERAGDPGLVAFNRAAVAFGRGKFREAELLYARTLDDPACPPERRARAWFNRGTCLVRRGGDAAAFRSAVACFERCLLAAPADPALAADARHNLELAKLLWAEERKKLATPPKANSTPPEDDDRPPKPPEPDRQQPPPETDPGTKPDAATPPTPRVKPKDGVAPAVGDPSKAGDVTAGAGNLPPLFDGDKPQALSPVDTREYLRRTADRLRRDRQATLRAVYGPGRDGVRDW